MLSKKYQIIDYRNLKGAHIDRVDEQGFESGFCLYLPGTTRCDWSVIACTAVYNGFFLVNNVNTVRTACQDRFLLLPYSISGLGIVLFLCGTISAVWIQERAHSPSLLRD